MRQDELYTNLDRGANCSMVEPILYKEFTIEQAIETTTKERQDNE